MAFLSYAQNFEDVMLWRALGHIPNGVYVDVGAQHPRIDSISRAFYEHGWRGTHIEPVPSFAEMLRQDRPDETVLEVAIGAADGMLELNVFADTGLSTAIQDYADRHQNERGYQTERITVPVQTLNAALRSLEGTDVHWLKVDVEGYEEQVLRGWQSDRLRPWVLVVEATIPNSPVTDYESWDPIVTAAGYRFVYFDGLNRFYIANEHPELADAFLVPPNIFDAVEVSGQASWGLYDYVAAAYEARLDALNAEVSSATASASASAVRLEEVERALVSSVAHIEWMQGQHEAEVKRLDAHMTWRQEQSDTEEKRLHTHIAWMQEQWDAARHEADARGRAANEALMMAEQLRRDLQVMHASTSWRITAVVRRSGDFARTLKRVPRRAARAVLRRALANPALKGRVLRLLAAAPGLEKGLRKLAIRAGLGVSPVVRQGHYAAPEAPAPDHVPDQRVLRELSPRASRILAEIHKAIDSKGQ